MDKHVTEALPVIAPIAEILPFVNRLRIFKMPAVRLIGKSVKDKLYSDPCPVPAFWTEYYTKGNNHTPDALPHLIPHTMSCSYDYCPDTNEYTYLICAACPAGTPVPDGFEYHDMPAGLVAQGVTNEDGSDAYALERYDPQLGQWGFSRDDYPWAEFYPEQRKPFFCVLFYVRPVETA